MWAINIYAEPIKGDELALEKLDADITAAEDRGNRKVLENILAKELAFRRANGVVVGMGQWKSREVIIYFLIAFENIYTRPLNYLGILEHRSVPTSHILEERL